MMIRCARRSHVIVSTEDIISTGIRARDRAGEIRPSSSHLGKTLNGPIQLLYETHRVCIKCGCVMVMDMDQ